MREQGDPAVLMVTGRTLELPVPWRTRTPWATCVVSLHSYEAGPDKQFKGGRVALAHGF